MGKLLWSCCFVHSSGSSSALASHSYCTLKQHSSQDVFSRLLVTGVMSLFSSSQVSALELEVVPSGQVLRFKGTVYSGGSGLLHTMVSQVGVHLSGQ